MNNNNPPPKPVKLEVVRDEVEEPGKFMVPTIEDTQVEEPVPPTSTNSDFGHGSLIGDLLIILEENI